MRKDNRDWFDGCRPGTRYVDWLAQVREDLPDDRRCLKARHQALSLAHRIPVVTVAAVLQKDEQARASLVDLITQAENNSAGQSRSLADF